jgi:RNA polymerase subunit RPABC4/transcription elongation factor Spt4
MAALSGKMTALVIFILVVLFLAFVLTPLALAPLGVFLGLSRGFHNISVNGFAFKPWFPFVPLWSLSFVFFLVWIVVIVWVYKDAEERKMNGVLWALLVFIGNLVGLIIYLIVRQDHPIPTQDQDATAPSIAPPAQPTISCPNCQKPVEKTFTYCPHCGAALQPVCRSCGKSVEASWKVCPHCGAQIKSE